jgi:hypothetical protein
VTQTPNLETPFLPATHTLMPPATVTYTAVASTGQESLLSTGSPTPPPPSSTPSPTASPTLAITTTATPTVRPLDRATALTNVSIFAAPDSNSAELAVIEAGQEVWVLGRSATGNWLYVSNSDGDRGFASANRFDWPGELQSLPVRSPIIVIIVPTAVPSPSSDNLVLELYQLEGTLQCNGEAWTMRVFISGRGGNGVYHYYWNNELLTANQSGSYTFVISSGGAPVIGTGRVTSGTLVAEKELFIVNPTCN